MEIKTQKDVILYMNRVHHNAFYTGINELDYNFKYKQYVKYIYECYPNAEIYEHCIYACKSLYGIGGRVDNIVIFYNENHERKHIRIILGFVNKKTSKYF